VPIASDPNLRVGFETSDDAGVYRLNDATAIVATADFITPPVDDPFVFGQVGAANSLSDVWAMGGRPLTCLNLIAFPVDKLGLETLRGVVEGALDRIVEAGAVLVGGHSVDDDEPKFGLAVTGVVHPDRVWTNRGARPGDVLVLTKPIGSGVLLNANLKGWVSERAMSACLDSMIVLNRTAAEVAGRFEIHAATDVTGFGLAGHALEMAKGSGVLVRIEAAEVPLMEEAIAMYERGMTTGSNAANRSLVREETRFEAAVEATHEEVFVDPQTSGGLLLSVPEDRGPEIVRALRDAGVGEAAIVGDIRSRSSGPSLIFR
jgi:selenide,water dikinase